MGTYFYFVVEIRPYVTGPWTAVYDSHSEEGRDDSTHRLAELHLRWKCYGLHGAFRELRSIHATFPPKGWIGHSRCFPDDATAATKATLNHADSTGWAYLEELEMIELTDAWKEPDTYYQHDRDAFVLVVRPGLRRLARGPQTVRMVWGFS